MAMLDKKFKHGKLKPQVFKDRDYLSWLHESEQPCCMVCSTYLGIQLHHVKGASSDKRNDNEVIPLCYNHHLGSEFSVHGTAKEFREVYPLEYQKEKAMELYQKYKDRVC